MKIGKIHLLVTVLLILIMSLSSCKKKKSTILDPTPEQTCMIQSMICEDKNITFTYDIDGKVVSARELVTGVESGTTGNHTYIYTSFGQILDYVNSLDHPANGYGGEFLSNRIKYFYDGVNRIEKVIYISFDSNGVDVLVDTTAFLYNNNSTVDYVKKSYLLHPSLFLLEEVHATVHLDVDGDPIIAYYKPFESSYYDTVTLSHPRDTSIVFAEYEYHTTDLEINDYFPGNDILLTSKKPIKKFTKYTVVPYGTSQSDRVIAYEFTTDLLNDSNGRVSNYNINLGIMTVAPPSYLFNSQYDYDNFTINYECQ